MATTPITLTPTGGPTYAIVTGHLWMPYTGVWIVDVEISADSLQQQNGAMPSGKVKLVFGGVSMSGTVDPTSSGTFGPTGRARIVGGANGWQNSCPNANGTNGDWHFDNGVSSTTIYQATASVVGETVKDINPVFFNVDFVRSANAPAMEVFRDNPWFVDVTGITNVGPRPSSTADASLVIRDFDPIHEKVTFSCDTLLIPNTTLTDPRFNKTTYTVYNVEQVFDGQGSIGWAWSNSVPSALITDELKAATLYWTRADYLRVYRYRLQTYQGNGPGGGPSRVALQAVTPSAGMPNLIPLQPWSGVAGVVSELEGSHEVLVIFENADPTLPRVIGYSLVATGGNPLGLPISTTMDASSALMLGISVKDVTVDCKSTLKLGVNPTNTIVDAKTSLKLGPTPSGPGSVAIGPAAPTLGATAGGAARVGDTVAGMFAITSGSTVVKIG